MCVRALPCSVCDANLTKRRLASACEFHQPTTQVVDTYGGTIAEQALLALKDGGISLSYSRQPEPYSKERAKGKAYTSAFASRASRHTRSTHMCALLTSHNRMRMHCPRPHPRVALAQHTERRCAPHR